MSDTAPLLISVDWGTTSLRCFLVGTGSQMLERVKSERGILKTDGVPFPEVLHGEIKPWLERFPDGKAVPVIMSGMIGSKQGWQEAAYLGQSATARALAGNLLRIDTAGGPLQRCDVRVVPGMSIQEIDELHQLPDVMRGEETQVLGEMITSSFSDGMVVLPGTHSKWVLVLDQEIEEFRTYMTGEIFSALMNSTILGRLAEGDKYHKRSFDLGAVTALNAHDFGRSVGDFLGMVFSARSRVLIGKLKPRGVHSYLSGFLIGAEIASALTTFEVVFDGEGKEQEIRIIADEPLRSRYIEAAALAGVEIKPASENPVPAAHLAIARMAGIVA